MPRSSIRQSTTPVPALPGYRTIEYNALNRTTPTLVMCVYEGNFSLSLRSETPPSSAIYTGYGAGGGRKDVPFITRRGPLHEHENAPFSPLNSPSTAQVTLGRPYQRQLMASPRLNL